MVHPAVAPRFVLAHPNARECLVAAVLHNNVAVLEDREVVPRPPLSWSANRSGANPMRPRAAKVAPPAGLVVLAACASRCPPASSCSCRSPAVGLPLVMVPGVHPHAQAVRHRAVPAKPPTAPTHPQRRRAVPATALQPLPAWLGVRGARIGMTAPGSMPCAVAHPRNSARRCTSLGRTTIP